MSGKRCSLLTIERVHHAEILGQRLHHQMRRRIAIGAAVIHVHVHVRAHPVAGIRHRAMVPSSRLTAMLERLPGGQRSARAPLEPALEARA